MSVFSLIKLSWASNNQAETILLILLPKKLVWKVERNVLSCVADTAMAWLGGADTATSWLGDAVTATSWLGDADTATSWLGVATPQQTGLAVATPLLSLPPAKSMQPLSHRCAAPLRKSPLVLKAKLQPFLCV